MEKFRRRTKSFAIDNISLFRDLSKTDEARIIGKQFLRSARSAAANYRAACRARPEQSFTLN
ncbi:MAG: four helix bundle protein [Bacteroidia bacterium]